MPKGGTYATSNLRRGLGQSHKAETDMETLRKLRNNRWGSKNLTQSTHSDLSHQKYLRPSGTLESEEEGSVGAGVNGRRRSDGSTGSGLSSPGASVLTGDTLGRSPSKHENPLGLNVIYKPTTVPAVDIIFVHGLGGTSRHTWTKDKDPDLFWPEKWLPFEPEICEARVLSFGYSAGARILDSGTILNVTDFAKDLLFCMEYGKDEQKDELNIGKVPIIFVVHSMGGLVVKKAYLLGQLDNRYKHITSSISAIVFLATPHRGSGLAELLDKILEVCFNPKQYVVDLKRDSPMLEGLNEEFRHIAPKLQIISFYETKTTPLAGGTAKKLVLNKESSILGYEGEVSNALQANHHEVCKYCDQYDPNYVRIRNILKTLVGRCRDAKSKISYGDSPNDLRKVQTLLALTEGPEDDQKFFHDRWMTGTCDWIKYEAFFNDWVQHSATSKILWLHGPPASGKSVLSSFIVEYLSSLDISCSFFFFRFGDQTKRSPNALLRSLAYQLAAQLPGFNRKLQHLHDDGLRLEKTDARTIWNKVYVGGLFKMELRDPLYWVIDALDESDASHSLLEILSSVSKAAIPIHLLLISRWTEHLSSSFDRTEQWPNIQTHTIQAQESDIHTFVRRELHYLRGSEAFKQHVLEGIRQRASGNFLWVSLAMKEIRKCHTEKAIEAALSEIPSGMGPLYKRMEMNIARDLREGDKDLAKHILIWATCSRRAMTLAELSQALEPDMGVILDLRRAIGEVCGQFVVVDNTSHVSMIHQTAKKYLLKTSDLEFSISGPDAHRQLFTKTLSFLLDPKLRAKLEQIAAIPASPFLQYAATCWPYHLGLSPLSGEKSLSLLPLLAKFFRGQHVLTWIHALAYFDELSVLVQVSKNLNTYVSKKRKLHADDVPLKQRIEDLELLELWAADLLKVFAKFAPNLRQQPSAIHKLVPPFCPKDSVLYQQYGKKLKDQTALSVTGLTNPSWDDCLAKLSLGSGLQALQMLCVRHYLCILTTSGVIILCDAQSLREVRRIGHGEFIFSIAASAQGETLISYGYHTTKLWSIPAGRLKRTLDNPKDCKALNALKFTGNDNAVLLGSNDKSIRKLDLTKPNQGWQILDPNLLMTEAFVPGSNTNTPRYMCFNPDASLVAVAYSGYPLSIWSLSKAQSIATLRRDTEKRKQSSMSWTGVDRVRWHPREDGEVLGLYNDGYVFKWNIYQEDTQEVHTRASEIACSPDGTLFATSDIGGIIKIWNYQHFALVYQLSCDNGITDLCFSPDCSRLYDLGGSMCNVWEPNALIRLTETEQRSSEKESEAGSTTHTSSASEAFAETADPITALDSSTKAMLYCAGNDEGVVNIFDFLGNKSEIYRSPGFLTIDIVHISEDGSTVAFSEVGGQVVILRISRSRSFPGQFDARLVQKFKIMEGIHQIRLSPDSRRLQIDGTSKATMWDVESGSCIGGFPGRNDRLEKMMINNPMDETQFVDLYVNHAVVSSWDHRGDTVKAFSYSNSMPELKSTRSHEQAPPLRRRSSPAGFTNLEVISGVENVVQTDGRHILVHIIRSFAGAQVESSVVIVPPASLVSHQGAGTDSASTFEIPARIMSNVRKPLGFYDDSFVYLDNESWVCTWQLDVEKDSVALKRHFFIPRDWLNSETLDLCMLMNNGIFLCPHYGEVAVIKSSLTKEW